MNFNRGDIVVANENTLGTIRRVYGSSGTVSIIVMAVDYMSGGDPLLIGRETLVYEDDIRMATSEDRDTFSYNFKVSAREGLGESRLRNIIREAVTGGLAQLNEVGNTETGQWLLGRLAARQARRGEPLTASDYAIKNGPYDNTHSVDFEDGWYDEEGYSEMDPRDSARKKSEDYAYHKGNDMNRIAKSFIKYLEEYNGGSNLQIVADYESGNETGFSQSPLGVLIPKFEEDVLGYKCPKDLVKEIGRQYRRWWNYAQYDLL